MPSTSIPLNGVSWTPIGSAPISTGSTGRLAAVAADPANSNVVYVASAGGGVWKTTNATAANPSWSTTTDNMSTLVSGAIAIAPSNTNIVYWGTGEGNSAVDSQYGRGVFKSTNAGASWSLVSGATFDRNCIEKIVVNPTDPNTLYLAAGGFATGNVGGVGGVWRSTDGGVTWTNITSASIAGSTGQPFMDLEAIPGSPNTLFTDVGNLFGASINGVYMTTNANAVSPTWTLVGGGLPSGTTIGRGELAVTPANASAIVFSVHASSGFGLFNMYRSTNGGATWSTLALGSEANYLGGQGWYDQTLAVSPTDANLIIAGGQVKVIKSTDGGLTWTNLGVLPGAPHPDHHGAAFDAAGRFIDGNDGGIWRYDPVGNTWSDLNGAITSPSVSTALNDTTVVSLALHPTDANIAYVGLQDNGTLQFNDSLQWTAVRGGDGGFTRVDQTNGSIVYHEYFGLSLEKSINGGATWVSATSGITSGSGGNFYRPYEIDPGNHNRLFYGTSVLWVSTNGAASWVNAGSYSGGNINSIGVGPASANIIYISNGGSVLVSTDGGANFTSRTPAGGSNFNDFAVDPTDSNICVVVARQFGASRVWRTTNAGVAWTDITSNLPNTPVNTVVQDPGVTVGTGDDVLYVGTADQGVWSSTNLGGTWAKFGIGLPNVQVNEMQINTSLGIIAAGTYGRGVWEMNTAAPSFIVTNTNDSGAGSLRQVILDANAVAGTQTITFDPLVFNAAKTITLTTGELPITDSVIVTGPSAPCTVSGNNASRIFNINGTGTLSVSMTGLTLTLGNSGSSNGAAIFNQDENLTLDGCTITSNTTTGACAGIWMQAAGASLTLLNSTVSNNKSTFNGAGIDSNGSATIIITNSTISGNSVSSFNGAGLEMFGGGSLTVTGSTFSGNSVAGNGGAIELQGTFSTALFVNSTISGNSATGSGGGINLSSSFVGTLTVDNSTITNNTAKGGAGGGGIARAGGTGTITIESTIVSGNVDSSGNARPDFFTTGTVNANVSAVGSKTGVTTFNADATTTALLGAALSLGALASNGGPTQTHALGAGSPAIDKGSNPTSAAFDQRGVGFPRQIGSPADIGAFEFIPASFVVTNTNDSGDGSLRHAVDESSAAFGFQSITFDPVVFATSKTINLTTGQLNVTDATNIIGPAARVTVDAGALSRVFFVDAPGSSNAVTMSNLIISGGLEDRGGGIYNEDETLSLTNVTVQNNAANITGGGIQLNNAAGSLSMTNCSVLNNKVSAGAGLHNGDGGGIFIFNNSVVTLNSCTVSGNLANDDGGGVYFYVFGTLNLNNSTVSGNKCTVDDGGGVYMFASTATIINSTISGNSAGDGGGGIVLFSGSNAKIQNSTIAFNTAAGATTGGGIWNSGSTLSIESTIVAKNTDTGAPDVGGNVTENFSLIQDITGATISGASNVNGVDPLLGALANNGGPTQTHALLAGSPAINKGSNPAAQTFDQRGTGFPRTLNAVADIGAVEFTPAGLVVRNTNDSGADSLRQCVIDSNGMVGTQQITFDPTVFNVAKAITLTTGELPVTDSAKILGPGAALVSVNGNAVGRVFNVNGAGTLDVTLSGMTITNGNASSGGGIVSTENLTLQQCVVTGNKATFTGGILAYTGTFTMSDCQVTNNVATSNVGGITSNGAGATIVRSTISGNSCSGSSGGLYVNGTLLMTESAVLNNSAVANGAGIFLDGATPFTCTVRNSTISGNSSSGGAGAIALGFNATYSFLGTLNVQNSTITNNSAKGGVGAGGIARLFGTGTINLDSSIVSGNFDTSGNARPDLFTAGTVNANFSAVGSKNGVTTFNGDAQTTALLGAALSLGALADNGGPTLTHLPAAGSPLIGKGSNPAGLTLDQRGGQRVIGGAIDIGSVETSPMFVVTNALDHGQGSLRQCTIDANITAGSQTITFDLVFFSTARTITLTTGEMALAETVNITGPGIAFAVVNGNAASRIFNVTAPVGNLITISGLGMTNGKQSANGAGINTGVANVTLNNVFITNCVNTGPGGGVGIPSGGGTITISNSTISGNTAGTRGGGVYFFTTGTLVMTNCTVSGNSASGPNGGGGLYNYSNSATISNSTFSGNTTSGSGGGIQIFNSGTVNVFNCTITGNSAAVAGGGINRAAGTLSLNSTIVAGNANPTTPDLHSAAAVNLAGDNNLIGAADGTGFTLTGAGNQTGTVAVPLNAKLGPLADNGGPTLTHLPLAGSPAIDKGNNVLALATDQRGAPRVVSGTADVGSVESSPQFVVTNDLDHGSGSLRQCLLDSNGAVGVQTITFDPVFFAALKTISLTTGEIPVTDSVNVTGPAVRPTVTGNLASRILNIGAGSPLTVNISNLTFTQGSSGNGGAIVAGDDALIFNNCVFQNNTAASDGGAIWLVGQLTANDCSFTGNTSGGIGGAFDIFTSVAKTILRRTTVSGNTASLAGGFYAGQYLLVDSSTISGNMHNDSGSFGGGGVFISNFSGPAAVTFRNSTISGNTSKHNGGGIYGAFPAAGSLLTIQNCTITANAATNSGGGIALSAGWATNIESSIVSGNAVGVGTGPDIFSPGTVTVKTSAIGNAGGFVLTDGGGNLPFQPVANLKLGPLAANGGPTLTHALLTGSPCINKGSNPAALTLDQRGFARVADGAIDIGAFEVQAPCITKVIINGGAAQRSKVLTIDVVFDILVTLPAMPETAFQLKRQSDNKLVDLTAAVVNTSFTTVTFTFNGALSEFTSLQDGRYTLTAFASKISGADGPLDGNCDGVGGDDYVLVGAPGTAPNLFRFYGDVDGDGAVAVSDFNVFRLSFGGSFAPLDFDNDGAVAASDFLQFRLRFGGMI